MRPDVLLDGLSFGECPRWREGRLWLSDMHARMVMTVTADGASEPIVEVPNQPAGLGWLPDGRLLVVSMTDRKVMRLEDGVLVEHADLGQLAAWHCNDMVVDAHGNAYVGNWGFALNAPGAVPERARLALVTPDGHVQAVGGELSYPNGLVVAEDGCTLIVAETLGARLTAFTIEEDGSLSHQRRFADLAPNIPDGICLDAEGAIWSADPMHGECIRVADGGDVLERVTTGRGCFACVLGGEDGCTLFMLTADDSDEARARELRSSRVETVRVEVPAAGVRSPS